MKRLYVTFLLAIVVSSCGTSSPNQDVGDTNVQDVPDVAMPDSAVPDSVTDLHDVHPGDVTRDTIPDITNDTTADTSTDLVGDVPFDATIPEGCCLVHDDCNGGSCAGAESHDFGICFPALEPGECWTDDDCGQNEKCHGAAYCPCGNDCDLAYEGHGVCVRQDLTCVIVPQDEILETCNAANLFLFDGQKCVGTCPGCCNCGPWCDLTFATMEECQTACASLLDPVDMCINQADAALIAAGEEDIQSKAVTCTMNCMSDADPAACTAQCTADATGLSAGCAACYSDQNICALNKCAGSCMTEPTSEACQTCLETEGCRPAFWTCKGTA